MSEIDWSKAPEGATHARNCGWEHPDWYKVVNGVLMAHSCGGPWDTSSYSAMDHIPNLQQRPSIEWTGTGLPPVGTVCEGSMPAWGEYRKDWMQCRVIAHENGSAVVIRHETVLGWCDTLRPIRTQTQIEAEERERAIRDMSNEISGYMGFDNPRSSDVGIATYLHDHGYRKQGEAK